MNIFKTISNAKDDSTIFSFSLKEAAWKARTVMLFCFFRFSVSREGRWQETTHRMTKKYKLVKREALAVQNQVS